MSGGLCFTLVVLYAVVLFLVNKVREPESEMLAYGLVPVLALLATWSAFNFGCWLNQPVEPARV
jgi:hypothetical protein